MRELKKFKRKILKYYELIIHRFYQELTLPTIDYNSEIMKKIPLKISEEYQNGLYGSILNTFSLSNFIFNQNAKIIHKELSNIEDLFNKILKKFKNKDAGAERSNETYLVIQRNFPIFVKIYNTNIFGSSINLANALDRSSSNLRVLQDVKTKPEYIDEKDHDRIEKTIHSLTKQMSSKDSLFVLFAVNALLKDKKTKCYIVDFKYETISDLSENLKSAYVKKDFINISSFNKLNKISEFMDYFCKKETSCLNSQTADTYHYVNDSESIFTKMNGDRRSSKFLKFRVVNYSTEAFINPFSPTFFNFRVVNKNFRIKSDYYKKLQQTSTFIKLTHTSSSITRSGNHYNLIVNILGINLLLNCSGGNIQRLSDGRLVYRDGAASFKNSHRLGDVITNPQLSDCIDQFRIHEICYEILTKIISHVGLNIESGNHSHLVFSNGNVTILNALCVLYSLNALYGGVDKEIMNSYISPIIGNGESRTNPRIIENISVYSEIRNYILNNSLSILSSINNLIKKIENDA